MIDRFLRAWYPGEWPDDPVFDRNRDEAGRTWRERLVEETRAALTAALASITAESGSEQKAAPALTPLHIELLRRGVRSKWIWRSDDAGRNCAEVCALGELERMGLVARDDSPPPPGPPSLAPSSITEKGREALRDIDRQQEDGAIERGTDA